MLLLIKNLMQLLKCNPGIAGLTFRASCILIFSLAYQTEAAALLNRLLCASPSD